MRYIVAIFATLFAQFINAQSFYTQVDRSEITLDQYIEVSFVLENVQGKNFAPPKFNGWTVIQGPSTSTSVQIINGARSSSISYTYVLSPKSVGNLSIDPANMLVNGKTESTKTITIKVSKGSPQANLKGDQKSLSKKDIFIIGRAIPESPFIGQQVIMEYKLYTNVDVENYNIIHAPAFEGFHRNNIPRLQFDSREVVNGKNYVTKVIYSVALYPIQSGTFEIDALHARASIVVENNRNDPRSFFLLPTTEGVNLISEKIKVVVRSLPEPSPANFSGAVGNFSMATSIDQLNVKTNDALSVTLYIEGDGDLNRVGKPYLELDSSSFQVYEPKITKENIDYKTNNFVGFREMIYPVIANKAGNHKIIPSFVYFHPDSQKYLTLSPEVFNITVTGSNIIKGQDAGKGVENSILALEPIKNPRYSARGNFVGSIGFYFLLLFPFLAWFASFIWVRKQNSQIRSSEHTRKIAARRNSILQELKSMIAKPDIAKKETDVAFGLLQEYLKLKWNINDLVLSTEQWAEKINSSPIDASAKENLKSIFSEVELAIYAGQLSSAHSKNMIMKIAESIQLLP